MNDLFSQAHSQTSKDAAAQNTTAGKLAEDIYRQLAFFGERGRTGDEIAARFNIPIGTASARLRGLELAGRIVKTNKKRKTRSNRQANVYVTKAIFNIYGLVADVSKSESELEKLKRENQNLRERLSKYETV